MLTDAVADKELNRVMGDILAKLSNKLNLHPQENNKRNKSVTPYLVSTLSLQHR